jgi:hypothetical protein
MPSAIRSLLPVLFAFALELTLVTTFLTLAFPFVLVQIDAGSHTLVIVNAVSVRIAPRAR